MFVVGKKTKDAPKTYFDVERVIKTVQYDSMDLYGVCYREMLALYRILFLLLFPTD